MPNWMILWRDPNNPTKAEIVAESVPGVDGGDAFLKSVPRALQAALGDDARKGGEFLALPLDAPNAPSQGMAVDLNIRFL